MTATYAGTAELQRFMGYDSTTNPFSVTQMQEALDRAQAEIDKRTSTHFSTGTDATPDWLTITEEKHTGKGFNNRTYFLDRYPLPDVSTYVNGTAVTAEDTTIYVASTAGFPSSGYICIEDDRIAYTGKTSTTFTGCTSVSAHGTAEYVYPFVIEISMTDRGQTPTWTVMELDKDCDIDLNSGRVYLFESTIDVSTTTSFSRFPAYQVPNRFRASYISGYNSIPDDINRLCLMIATKDLMHSVVRKAHSAGRDGFAPEVISIDEKWIEDTINSYKSIKTSNI